MRPEDEADQTQGSPPVSPPQPPQPPPDPAAAGQGNGDLETVLKELKDKKKQQDGAQVEAKIAELEKLVAEAGAAEADFAAEHPALVREEDRLRNEMAAQTTALEAILKPEGIADVKEKIAERVKAVADAEAAVTAAALAASKAKEEAEAATQARKEAEVRLAAWKKPVKGVSARHKAADTAIKEVQKLRNSGRPSEAYWKLVLASQVETPGLESVAAILDGTLPLIPLAELRGKLEQVWAAYSDAKSAEAQKALALAEAGAGLAAATKVRDEFAKNLVRAITEALAERDAPAQAA